MRNDKVKSAAAVIGAFVMVLAIGTVGWTLVRGNSSSAATATWQEAAASPSDSPSATPTPEPLPTTAAPSPTAAPTKKPPAKKKPVVTATKKPPAAQLPPAPPAPVAESASCTQHPGPDAPPSEVSAALVAAGAKQHWVGVQPPAGLTGSLPKITVPANLMKAVAWAESSWQSTVIACDHGVGLMQIMEPTREFLNDRFDTNYAIAPVADNAALGATYLQWLTMYFGLYYFGTFDLTAVEPVGDGGAELRLRDVVIAAYNVGHGAVENLHGTDDASDDTLSIPNQWYVDRVSGYMTNCPCEA